MSFTARRLEDRLTKQDWYLGPVSRAWHLGETRHYQFVLVSGWEAECNLNSSGRDHPNVNRRAAKRSPYGHGHSGDHRGVC